MKRTWKNFKIDKNKVYMRIRQAVVIILANAGMTAMLVYGFIKNTIY